MCENYSPRSRDCNVYSCASKANRYRASLRITHVTITPQDHDCQSFESLPLIHLHSTSTYKTTPQNARASETFNQSLLLSTSPEGPGSWATKIPKKAYVSHSYSTWVGHLLVLFAMKAKDHRTWISLAPAFLPGFVGICRGPAEEGARAGGCRDAR